MASIDKSTLQAGVLPAGMDPAADKATLWIQNLTKEGGNGGWVTRPGFGLVARLDSSLTAGKTSNTNDLGITRVIGSFSYTTNFGHDLILSLARVQGWVTDTAGTFSSTRGTVYSLFVYDLTYDSFTEHSLHHHTLGETTDIWRRHGHYDTDVLRDRQVWYDAGQGALLGDRSPVDTEGAYFTVIDDRVIFGTTKLGAWVFSPGLPSANRTQANSAATQDWKAPYSEDCTAQPIALRSGFSGEGYTYLTKEEFGRPTAACAYGERVVYAVGNLLFYSDPGEPSAIAALNVDRFPVDLTAVTSRYGVIYAFSKDRTYMIHPANGFIISGGSISDISTEVGCIGPAAITEAGSNIVFAHTSGIYALAGSTGIQNISNSINPLFEGEGLENLWSRLLSLTITSFGNGSSPRTYYQWTTREQATAYLEADDRGRIFFGIPESNVALVLEEGGWHAWSFETVANSNSNIEVTAYLPKGQITCIGSRVFMVTDITEQSQTDGSSEFGGGTTGYVNPNRSFAVCELGRGGSLDRSSGTYEDKRLMAGEYYNDGTNDQSGIDVRDRGYYVVRPPIPIEAGTSFPWASVTVGASDYAFYLPIELVPPTASIDPGNTNLIAYEMRFWFDNTNYEPYLNTAAANNYEVTFNLPPERLSAAAAYSIGVASSATPEGVMLYNNGTGTPSTTGDEIRIYVAGAFGGAWTGHPEFSFAPRHANPMILIPFKRKNTATGDVFAMGFQYLDGSVTNVTPTTTQIECIAWRDATNDFRYDWTEGGGNFAQAVDWGVHASELQFDGIQMKARGLTFELQSSGQADPSEVAASWPNGLLNVAMSANRKGVAGQIVDIPAGVALNTPGITGFSHDSLRSRGRNTALSIVPPTFNSGFTWGDDGDANSGNFLVADTATDTITTSGSMKGDKLIVSFWGHIRDKAERLKVFSAKAIVRAIGGAPRRRGR